VLISVHQWLKDSNTTDGDAFGLGGVKWSGNVCKELVFVGLFLFGAGFVEAFGEAALLLKIAGLAVKEAFGEVVGLGGLV